MGSKFLNLDLDNTLGGNSSSDYKISSQKAIKTYVDNQLISVTSDTEGDVILNSLGGSSLVIDSALSNSSVNPVQNKIIYTAFNNSVKVYTVLGKIASATGDVLEGVGVAFIKLYNNGIAEVNYNLKFSVGGTSTSVLTWGISPSDIKTLNNNIPVITPKFGGTCVIYETNGNILSDIDYGGTHDASSGYWTFSRVYNTSGASDVYSTNIAALNRRWVGTCYGTYTNN